MGVLAALVAGFDRVAAQPLLLLPVVLLDLFLWLGPHLAVPQISQLASSARAMPAGVAPAVADQLQAYREAIMQVAASYNLFSALSTLPAGMPFNLLFGVVASLAAGLPSLLALRLPTGTPRGAAVSWSVPGLGAGFWIWLGLSAAGVGVATFYLQGVARGQAHGGTVSTFRSAYPRLLVLAGGGYLITFVVLLGTALIGSMNGVLYVGMPLLFVGAVYLSFTIPGVVRYDLRIGQAMRESLRIVRWNFFAVMGMLLLSFFIVWTAASQVWSLPGEGSWYMILAIVGHAFVSTTLVSASYAFYQGRREWMLALAERVLQQRMQQARPPEGSEGQDDG